MKNPLLDLAATLKELEEQHEACLQSLDTLSRLGPVEIGQTPNRCVYQIDKVRLLHYRPQRPIPSARPLLMVYALVNRPDILDLEPQRSLIRSLLDQGLELFLIDWGYPDAADRFTDLQDYLLDYLHSCVEQVQQLTRCSQVDLLGICQGGTFALCYCALFPERIHNLITLVTPVDFRTQDNTLSQLVQQIDAELAVDALGNIPGPLISQNFNMLKPMQHGLQKYIDLPYKLREQPSALSHLRMERWLNDCPDQAGEAFREFIQVFFQENRLINGGLEIGGMPVCLGRIRQPILNIYGTQDHIVPPSASQALARLTQSKDYQELALPAGHIGAFVSAKCQRQLVNTLTSWLAAHPTQ